MPSPFPLGMLTQCTDATDLEGTDRLEILELEPDLGSFVDAEANQRRPDRGGSPGGDDRGRR